MFTRTGIILLILGTSQVLSDYVPADYLENQQKNDVATGSRIVSGWPAELGQYPHQVSVRMLAASGLTSSCGGSIVHRGWVITAAHCTAGQMVLVIRAGVVNLLLQPAFLDETREWYNFPSYDNSRPLVVQPNDISAVRLQNELTYSPTVQPIRIQSSSEAASNYGGQVLVASGFGAIWTGGAASNTLNWVYLRGVDNTECARIFGTGLITPAAVCAQFYNVTTQSICQGDSGGPLIHVQADGSPTLVGVSSFVAGGDFGCHSVHPGGFIRPGAFHAWLQQVTGIDFQNLDETPTEPPTEPPTTLLPTTLPPTTLPPTTLPPTTLPPTTLPPTTTNEPEPEPTTSAPITTTTAAPPTSTPQPESEESTEKPETEEDSSSSSEEDADLKDLLKRLEVMVNVKVKLDKYKSKHKVHEVVNK